MDTWPDTEFTLYNASFIFIFDISQGFLQFIQIPCIEIGVKKFYRPVTICHGIQSLLDILNDHSQIFSHCNGGTIHLCHFVICLYFREL